MTYTAGEELETQPYCDLCETYGHTFRSCPKRDDNYYDELDDLEEG